jgi:bifunctional non-homologous end joining protein LigD
MALETYRKKRNFKTTPEPKGGKVKRKAAGRLSFVIQKHAASHLHYDFRLELDGVLLSWAVPKGPSLDPTVRRLAMHVEDHPIEYGDFEGIIPPRQYGSGTVMLWDRGTWMPKEEPREGYRKGRLKFELQGEKLKGGWVLVKSRGGKYGGDKSWLLIKENDEHARRENGAIVDDEPNSVATGRGLEEIAASGDRVWHSNKSVSENVKSGAVRKKKPVALDPSRVGGATKAPLPAFIEPELATLVKQTPAGAEWLHEMKLDGYRMGCRIDNGKAIIYTRNRNDWTASFPAIADAAARLPVKSAWLDGEIAVMRPNGVTSFQDLQNALSRPGTAKLHYFLFDLPYLNGYDLRKVPLVERKQLLEKLLSGVPDVLRYSSHVMGKGEQFYDQACKLELEGVVAKRAASPYRAGRGRDWVKVKCSQRQEMVIGGYTDPSGARQGLGALLIGIYEKDGSLRYSGKVGTGFNDETLTSLRKKLETLGQKDPPFSNPPRGAEGRRAHWVKPRLVAEIAFTEWTADGTLRHPSFQGLREDKNARDVVRERPADEVRDSNASPPKASKTPKKSAPQKRSPVSTVTSRQSRVTVTSAAAARDARNVIAGVTISNPDKLLYPDAGLSKTDVARYYETMAEWMLPHVQNRPLSLVRCPNGWQQKCFYQKHANESVSDLLDRVTVRESDGPGTYMMANSTPALVALAQMGILEIHPWGSTAKKQGCPDRLIFDIDPDDKVPWRNIAEAARQLKTVLEQLGLACFLKTTGGKGLHVMVPIKPVQPWDQAKTFTKAIADLFVRTFPDRFTAQMAKAARRGKMFIDYLRNDEGSTAIAPYSLRARANAPVATPLEWDELDEDVRFDHFNLKNIPARAKRLKRDPWRDLERAEREITPTMMGKVGLKAR